MIKDLIVFSSDDFYSIHACALIKSIEENSKYDQLEIHVLSDGIKEKNKKALQSIGSIPLFFHEFNKAFLQQNPLPQKTTYLPRSAYFRLLIPTIFPHANRALYVDVDTIVLGNLAELFQYDFKGKSCLACLDYGKTPTKTSVSQIHKKNPDSQYFNSGVMVINIQKWIEKEVKKKSFHLLENGMKSPEYADQEVLNVILEDDWLQLDAKWNYPPHISDYDNMPRIIHFMGYKPIFKSYKDKHKDTFYHFLRGTKWENTDYGIIKKTLVKGPYKLKTRWIKLKQRIMSKF